LITQQPPIASTSPASHALKNDCTRKSSAAAFLKETFSQNYSRASGGFDKSDLSLAAAA
jgi:hypothetical protein